MSVEVYIPSAIRFASGNPITQIDPDNGFSTNPGFEHLSVTPAGSVTPGFTGSNVSAPQCEVTTTQIKDVLDRLTTDDVCAGFNNSAVTLEYYKMSNLGTRPVIGSASHATAGGSFALGYWSGISAQGQQPATIDFSMMFLSDDGINAPLTFASGVALSASPVVQHVYGLGGLKIGSSFVCIDSLNWQNNINAPPPKTCSGGSYPTYANVKNYATICTVETENVSDVFGHLPAGSAITSVDFFLRKRAASGINVATGTAEHIKLSATAGTIKPGTNSNQIEFHLHSFSVNTASAIS